MNTSKKLLLTGILATVATTQSVSMKNFDATLLNPYIMQAQKNLELVAEQLQYEGQKCTKTVKANAKRAKELYSKQKAALKVTLKKLKHAALELKEKDEKRWVPARQLYKAFKHNVYETWKKGFKKEIKRIKKIDAQSDDLSTQDARFCNYGPSLDLVSKKQ